jgi:hypothetical protein
MARLERTEKPINVIIEERQRGDLGLPEIQRGYVWKQTQVRDLIESMYKEYPCGLILLWKPPSEMLDNLRLRESDISLPRAANGKNPTFLVLDGQQRLTSIMRVLDGVTDVYFNVEEEKFEIKSPKIKGNPLWISVTAIFKDGATKVWRELKKKINDIDEDKWDDYLERISKIEKVKEYRIPVEILHTDDYEEITEAFIRINSKGTKLREAELALAQLALRLPGMVSIEFENALDEYEESNFEFEARFLMRCFVAVSTGQSRFKFLSKLWQLGENKLTDYWSLTKRGVDNTISFLRTNVGIESTDWIPSINALVPLVVYFAKNKHVSDEESKLLLFWYYSANMWGRYSSSAETKLDQDLDALTDKETGVLKENGIDVLIRNSKRDVADLIVDEDELSEVYQRSAFLPLLFAIVRKSGAKDWFNGIELSATNVGPDNKIEMHHFFSRSVLKKQGFLPSEYDDFSNIVFLSRRANRDIRNSVPFKYVDKYKIEQKRLEEQFVPTDSELWKIENYAKFLEVRRKNLAKAMNKYLSEFGAKYMDKRAEKA